MDVLLSRREFWRRYAPSNIRLQVFAGGVCGCLSAAATLWGALAFNPVLLVDALLMLALVLGSWLGKSRVCALALCGYFLFSKITQFMAGGGFGGIIAVVLFIAFGAMALGLFRFQKMWQAYRQGGVVPLSDQDPWNNG